MHLRLGLFWQDFQFGNNSMFITIELLLDYMSTIIYITFLIYFPTKPQNEERVNVLLPFFTSLQTSFFVFFLTSSILSASPCVLCAYSIPLLKPPSPLLPYWRDSTFNKIEWHTYKAAWPVSPWTRMEQAGKAEELWVFCYF
jgi:hypothetical protein